MRKRVEETFGWMKSVGGFRRTRYRGVERTGLAGYLMATAYNLVRMSRLLTPQKTKAIQPAWAALGEVGPKSSAGPAEPRQSSSETSPTPAVITRSTVCP